MENCMHVDWNSWLEMVSGKGREETVPFIRFLGENSPRGEETEK